MKTAFGPVTIGSRLATIADRLAGKTAITEGEAQVSYLELDAAATTIAGHIAAAGSDRPGFVCLLFQGKTAAIKAILGASRCGRAYVSLDAGDPDERLRFILQDSAPIAVLTERALLERARVLGHAGCEIIDIDGLEPWDEAKPLPAVSPDAPAYLVYTSGSTGAPKGVCQTQRNLLFFADAYAKALGITEADRLSLVFSLSFGASNMNIFAGLLNGGTLCAYDMRRDGIPLLADWLDRERISVLHTVPTVFRELMNNLPPERKLAHLRAIDLAGESMFDSDVDLFGRHTQASCSLINQLGATEASIIAQHRVECRAAPHAGRILPVGRSPEGLRVLIRREDGSEADRNEVGEIVVSSPHVSPGYWRRPELNASTFSTDPLDPGWRHYFTRDLGRIDDKGKLHFLGRKGSRVKIRGHSVDLMEVEAALSACPGVTKAAVLAVGEGPQKEADRLVAYLAVVEDSERNPLRIRRRLAKRLPSYMLPTAFLFLDALPLTSSGKIDRKALSAIEPPTEQQPQVEPPRDDLERTIVGIFRELLKQAPIGRGDDFFLHGGDSLSLVELQIRLRDAFGVSLTNLYHDATVSGIAAGIRANRMQATQGPRSMPILVPLREKGDKPPLFLIHGRLGQAFVSPHFLRLLGDDQPVWAFQARGLDGLQEPHATIEAMAAEYLNEMRKRRPEGPYFIGALCVGAFVANVIARSLREAGESVLPLLLFDPPDRPFEMDAARVTEQALLDRIRSKQAMGRIAPRLHDPVYAKASVRTALAYEYAIRTHQPRPYDGPVLMISSRARMRKTDPMGLKRLFTGEVERLEVATTHKQLLDVRNEVFASHLKHCLGLIGAAANTG
jgi:amino acid adenylation domain-containing protein